LLNEQLSGVTAYYLKTAMCHYYAINDCACQRNTELFTVLNEQLSGVTSCYLKMCHYYAINDCACQRDTEIAWR